MFSTPQEALTLILRHRSAKVYRQYKNMDRDSRDTLRAFQLQKLQQVIQRTAQTNSFYKDLWKQHGAPNRIETLEDLKKFPLVNKDMLRAGQKAGTVLSSDLANAKSNTVDATTGSSGEPFRVIINRECRDARVASQLLVQDWYGQKPGDFLVKLWRAPLHPSLDVRAKESILRRKTLSIYDPDHPRETFLNPTRTKELISELNHLKPRFIDGFVSALVALSRSILSGDAKLHFKPEAIATGAEALSPEDREIIQSAFQAPVVNRYGGTEFGIIAHECLSQAKDKHYLHTLDYKGIIEVVDGEIVFTDFDSFAMPVIRYRTGDSGVLASPDERCGCGRPLGMLKEVSGRVNDIFVLRDGAQISTHLWHNYVKKCLGILNYQIIQKDVSDFEVRFVLAQNVDLKDLEKVKGLIKEALSGCTIEWKTLDEIPPGPGGKLRQTISLVKNRT